MCLGGLCYTSMLFFCSTSPSDEALRLLRRTQCQSELILAETHRLQGELADATARAYATMGGCFIDIIIIIINISFIILTTI